MRQIELVGRGITLEIQTQLMITTSDGEQIVRDVEMRDMPNDLPRGTLFYYFHDKVTVDIPSAEFPEGVMSFSNDGVHNPSNVFVPLGRRFAVDDEEIPSHLAARITRDREKGELNYTYVVEVFTEHSALPEGMIAGGGGKDEIEILEEVVDVAPMPVASFSLDISIPLDPDECANCPVHNFCHSATGAEEIDDECDTCPDRHGCELYDDEPATMESDGVE